MTSAKECHGMKTEMSKIWLFLIKQIKRAAESDGKKGAARLKQQEIFS